MDRLKRLKSWWNKKKEQVVDYWIGDELKKEHNLKKQAELIKLIFRTDEEKKILVHILDYFRFNRLSKKTFYEDNTKEVINKMKAKLPENDVLKKTKKEKQIDIFLSIINIVAQFTLNVIRNEDWYRPIYKQFFKEMNLPKSPNRPSSEENIGKKVMQEQLEKLIDILQHQILGQEWFINTTTALENGTFYKEVLSENDLPLKF